MRVQPGSKRILGGARRTGGQHVGRFHTLESPLLSCSSFLAEGIEKDRQREKKH